VRRTYGTATTSCTEDTVGLACREYNQVLDYTAQRANKLGLPLLFVFGLTEEFCTPPTNALTLTVVAVKNRAAAKLTERVVDAATTLAKRCPNLKYTRTPKFG
jgi:hypothetical protein